MSEIVLSLYRGEIVRPDSVSMKSIAEAVASRHALTVDDLRGQSRRKRVARPRQEAMWLMRQVRRLDGQHRYSLPMIGDFLGGRDHSTVKHGVEAHEGRLAAGRSPA